MPSEPPETSRSADKIAKQRAAAWALRGGRFVSGEFPQQGLARHVPHVDLSIVGAGRQTLAVRTARDFEDLGRWVVLGPQIADLLEPVIPQRYDAVGPRGHRTVPKPVRGYHESTT